MNYTQQQIDALIEGVYDGSITTRDLPVGLYNAISQKLLSALGSVEGKPSQSLLNQLSENIYMFSGAKVYQQIQDISLLANDETIKSFANFRDEALAIYDQYNKNWLETEYSTAIGQAQSAVRWEQVEAQKGELPFLQYSAVIDPNTSDICLPLDGICLPVDDPFWDINTPLNHFNCRCTVIQLDKTDATQTGITSKEDADKATAEITELRQPLFEGNSGKDRLIYNKEHPYFDVPKADREFAKENFGLPIPQLESLFTPAKTIEQATENINVFAETLTKQELNSISNYTAGDYLDINGFLRGRQGFQELAENKDFINQIETLSNTLEKAPKFNGTSYRGLWFDDENKFNTFIEQFKNPLYVEKGFLSTSLEQKVVEGFQEGEFWVKMEVNSQKGVFLGKTSMVESEKEILLNKGSKFVINEIKRESEKSFIIKITEL